MAFMQKDESVRSCLSVTELAKQWGVSSRTIWNYVKTDKNLLPHFRLGSRCLIPIDELQQWRDNQIAAAKTNVSSKETKS